MMGQASRASKELS